MDSSLKRSFDETIRKSQRKRVKPRRFSNSDFNFELDTIYANDIALDQEIIAWNSFYADEKISDQPFSGIGIKDTMNMIYSSLKTIRSSSSSSNRLINGNDVILEIGHGKHPLLWDLKMKFTKFKYYFGIEFSNTAIHEAIKLRLKNGLLQSEVELDDNVEFLAARSINYFNDDNTANVDVILPVGLKSSKLKAGIVSIILGKSFLDYITCRLSQSVNILNWEEEPRISNSIVDMFNCLSIALRDSSVIGGGVPSEARTEVTNVVRKVVPNGMRMEVPSGMRNLEGGSEQSEDGGPSERSEEGGNFFEERGKFSEQNEDVKPPSTEDGDIKASSTQSIKLPSTKFIKPSSTQFIKPPPVIILVEPEYVLIKILIFTSSDFVKFRDHICTIAKVIYNTTFVKISPARFLRLVNVKRNKNIGAICYTFQKFNYTYNNYIELRQDLCNVTKGLYQLQAHQDSDWLLPYSVPPKWKSDEIKDFDNVSIV